MHNFITQRLNTSVERLISEPLQKKTIHLWIIPLTQACFPETAFLVLSQDEQYNANRFRFKKHRDGYILCHSAVRHILSYYVLSPPEEITFTHTTHQKPFLAFNPHHLYFNISHAHQMALFAINTDTPIGVDIEHISAIEDVDLLAQQFFSKLESQRFLLLPSSKKLEAFYTIWTRKEAFIKAIGEGLSYPLDQFETTFLPHEPTKINHIKKSVLEAQQWFLKGFSLKHQHDIYDSNYHDIYIGALITKSNPKTIITFGDTVTTALTCV